ncbi:phycobiliprotein lyase [Candidatus Synechococcus spongiarum]|uniref:phycobiliprotein lyase n=1 Tax=Candidatus Synechococcus spongiarum TaxID=431041 RepID=UPI0005587ABC|nr:phycobiliprotein lyase [Candidatus Synechococcus spongiarum]
MADFLRLSAGTWLSVRSVHHFDFSPDQSGESNLIITLLEQEDEAVQRVCAQQQVPCNAAAMGARFQWQGNHRQGPADERYGAVLVDLPGPDQGCGRLVRDVGYVEATPVISPYSFDGDGLLTIHTVYDRNVGSERCWFLNEDVRVRVGTVQLMDGPNLVSYATETRCTPLEDFEKLRRVAQGRCESTS